MCWGLINSEWGQHTNWAQAGGLQNWKQHLKFFREKLSFGMAVNVGCANKLSWKGDVFLPPFPTLCTPCTSLPSSLPPLLYYPNCGTHTGSIRWWGASLLGIINSGGGREQYTGAQVGPYGYPTPFFYCSDYFYFYLHTTFSTSMSACTWKQYLHRPGSILIPGTLRRLLLLLTVDYFYYFNYLWLLLVQYLHTIGGPIPIRSTLPILLFLLIQ